MLVKGAIKNDCKFSMIYMEIYIYVPLFPQNWKVSIDFTDVNVEDRKRSSNKLGKHTVALENIAVALNNRNACRYNFWQEKVRAKVKEI